MKSGTILTYVCLSIYGYIVLVFPLTRLYVGLFVRYQIRNAQLHVGGRGMLFVCFCFLSFFLSLLVRSYMSITPGMFDLILFVPSTIFQLNRDGPSWVEPVLS